jgi:Cu-Zn family superoxide dismutase
VADSYGNATASFEVTGFTVGGGAADIVGKGLIVHRDPDDYKSQPAGNSGKRVACGVIRAAGS